MVRLVERGTNQIVHGSVDNNELTIAVALAIEHASEQQARFGHDGAAGLDQDFQIVSGSAAAHGSG